jgi:hypothetical protein
MTESIGKSSAESTLEARVERPLYVTKACLEIGDRINLIVNVIVVDGDGRSIKSANLDLL